jgi:thymidylate kinase
MKSKLIAIEGSDRVGKQTQSIMLNAYIKSINRSSQKVEVPYNDSFTHKLIYWMLKNGAAKSFPLLFQVIQVLNRIIFQIFVLPKYSDCEYIVLDRWLASTWVYGSAEGLSPRVLRFLCSFVKRPDFTVVLYGTPHVQEVRDVYEADLALQASVRLKYLEWSQAHPCCSTVIDANQDMQTVFSKIIETLQKNSVL